MDDLSVVIVTYNNQASIGATLEALPAALGCETEVMCIDNASVDHTVKRVREAGRVVLLRNNRNIGFSAACNQGIRSTRGKNILFLNPDVVLAPGCVAKMQDALSSKPPQVAGVGPKLWLPPIARLKPRQIDSAGISLGLHRLSPHDRGHGEFDRGQYDSHEGYLGPSGACVLFRRSTLDALAVDGEIFDEDFFAYFEDVDLVWRARLLGFSFAFVPKANGFHARKNPRHFSTAVQARAFVNRYFCVLKNDPDLDAKWLRPAAFELARLVYKTLTLPGFSVALGHLAENLMRMLDKRKAIQARRVVSRSVMQDCT